ncbi:MAG: DUF2946 domain-containing protein [Alphaproteobacteria bacterium]|nr:DUF2946 domain-containing protein [Alphaproteobacteria bacterium]
MPLALGAALANRRHFHIATFALFVALLTRALVPAGWMPAVDGRGLALCTMDGAVTEAVHHGDTPDSSHRDSNSVCPFAAAAHSAPPPSVITVLLPRLSEHVADIVPAYATVIANAPPTQNTPRAPPFFI